MIEGLGTVPAGKDLKAWWTTDSPILTEGSRAQEQYGGVDVYCCLSAVIYHGVKVSSSLTSLLTGTSLCMQPLHLSLYALSIYCNFHTVILEIFV